MPISHGMKDKQPTLRPKYWAEDGYELFEDDGKMGFSEEMEQSVASTTEPFVASENRQEYRATWLKDGKNATFFPFDGQVFISEFTQCGKKGDPICGVIRLLRV